MASQGGGMASDEDERMVRYSMGGGCGDVVLV